MLITQMNCLKNNLILFLLSFIATTQVGLVFRTEYLIRLVQDFEPVVIQVVESVLEEPEQEVEPEVVPTRINVPLDDVTQQMILNKCAEYNIDFAFTMAVIYTESSFRPDADSGSSVGLMQINRINHGWLSDRLGITDFFDPEQNVTAGLYMLRDLFEKYEDPAMVLMAYNMGEAGAKKLWDKDIYSTDYVEKVFQQAEIYSNEVMNNVHG